MEREEDHVMYNICKRTLHQKIIQRRETYIQKYMTTCLLTAVGHPLPASDSPPPERSPLVGYLALARPESIRSASPSPVVSAVRISIRHRRRLHSYSRPCRCRHCRRWMRLRRPSSSSISGKIYRRRIRSVPTRKTAVAEEVGRGAVSSRDDVGDYPRRAG